MPTTPEIFISYAWGETREDIVNKLYDSLTSKGYNVIRDKVTLGYRGKIKEFMERIGAGQAVIVVLSEKYLKSKNCMFEALQIREHGDLEKRIFPIVLSDANIFEALVRIRYRKFWDDKITELNEALRGMNDLAYLNTINEELNLFSEIKRFIDEFMGIVANMNVLTPEMHQEADFKHLIDALDVLFSEDQTTPQVIQDVVPIQPESVEKIAPEVAQKVRELVASGRLEVAIQVLRHNAGKSIMIEITSLEAQFRDLKSKELNGLLSFDEITKAQNNIVYRLLKLLE